VVRLQLDEHESSQLRKAVRWKAIKKFFCYSLHVLLVDIKSTCFT
jgi:hypothetical protein